MADDGRWPDARVAQAVYKRNLEGSTDWLGNLGEVNLAVSLRLLQLRY